MKHWLTATVCALGLGASGARAAPDTFGVGTGRNGELKVAALGTVINSYAPVTAAVASRATSLSIGSCTGDPACFKTGDLVLVYQAAGLQPVPASGARDVIDVSPGPLGQWEFARLAESSSSGQLEFTQPLVGAYAANETQVIRVPEYTQVTLEPGRSLVAGAWNGSTGGVVALLVTGLVDNRGDISANFTGFRGGAFVNGSSMGGCAGVDEQAPLGAIKGEGLVGASRYGATWTGRGNTANGGGGAVCLRSGGGGGGNGGSGGQGGRTDASLDGARDVGGLGGGALSHGPRDGSSDAVLRRLTFGGGGGAGYGIASDGGAGGAGGGVVFLRASQLTGSGNLTTSGRLGGSGSEGGGGGGAGGTLYVRIVQTAACGLASASGGIGGTSSSPRVGPGGGGGAGHMVFQAAPGAACTLATTGANPGTQQDPSDGSYGAVAGEATTATKLGYGFIIPLPPTVASPLAGSYINTVRPPLTGTARPNLQVILYVDGVEVGRTTSDAAGNFTLALTQDLSEGPHTVVAIAAVDAVQSLDSTPDTFTVDITPPDTTIPEGPGRFTRARDVTFGFGASEDGVTYLCKLDDAADFTPCPSPYTATGLADGPHTLQVVARDRAGNQDATPATLSFQITVADLSLLGDGFGGCSATGPGASLLLAGALGALALRRRTRGR